MNIFRFVGSGIACPFLVSFLVFHIRVGRSVRSRTKTDMRPVIGRVRRIYRSEIDRRCVKCVLISRSLVIVRSMILVDVGGRVDDQTDTRSQVDVQTRTETHLMITDIAVVIIQLIRFQHPLIVVVIYRRIVLNHFGTATDGYTCPMVNALVFE